ncbi:MAG: hypothetical protein SGJ10_07085 [Bacteroidota bacterium]|nr:hypothetical protein [Bacteroidota bacterium]
MKKIIFTLCVITVIGFSSCYYDKEANLYPKPISSCDTTATNLVYGNIIKTIMDQNCSLGGCHNTSSAMSNIVTDTYAGLRDAFTNRNLMCTVEQTTGACSKMPKNNLKLSDCKITQLKIWEQRSFPQ